MEHPAHPRFGLFNTEERILRSEEMGQSFRIGVWFPFTHHDSSHSFPVLYVPDGEYAFPLAAGLAPVLIGTQEVPELLIVGIAYHGIAGWREHGLLRDRDLCPAGFQEPPAGSRIDAFVRFFEHHLFPLVEGQYRGRADDRAIFGFSSGGLFALHAMLTRPGMFRRHVAAACTWPGADQYLLARECEYAAQPTHPPVDLYLSAGSLDTDQRQGFDALVETLRSRRHPGLRMVAEVLEGEGHNAGTLAKTLLYGLRAVYAPGTQPA